VYSLCSGSKLGSDEDTVLAGESHDRQATAADIILYDSKTRRLRGLQDLIVSSRLPTVGVEIGCRTGVITQLRTDTGLISGARRGEWSVRHVPPRRH